MTHYELFCTIVKNVFLGKEFTIDGVIHHPFPFLVKVSSFFSPSTSEPDLFYNLPENFANSAKTDLTRSKGGWIVRGIQDNVLRLIVFKEDQYLIPRLTQQNIIGVEGSGLKIGDQWLYIISCFCDVQAADIYLSKHLELPKSKEWKSSRTDLIYKNRLKNQLELFCNLFCEFTLLMHTMLFYADPKVFYRNLVKKKNERFSKRELKKRLRVMERELVLEWVLGDLLRDNDSLRQYLLNQSKGVQFDLDNYEFRIANQDFIERYYRFISLGYQNGKFPLIFHPSLKSEDSIAVQLADLMVGTIAHDFKKDKSLPPFLDEIPFTDKLVRRNFLQEKDLVSFYFWKRVEETTTKP